jgi:glycosyltransferase involved in cell wall biosynthesis
MLIATRNRKNEIRTLLSSLVDQDLDQIVISASGEDISTVTSHFKGLLNLTYIRSEPGQIRQKLSGIKELRSDLDWIIFSDDDVEYPAHFIDRLKYSITDHGNSNLSGIGFQIVNGDIPPNGKFKKFFNWIFLLQSGKPGSVNSSGDCIPYSESKEPIATMWLNGASAWRYEHVLGYESPVSETRYAAYEDAIFSYSNYVSDNLVFLPCLKLRYQKPENQTSLDAATYESYLLWKMYFVAKFELSFPKFIWSSLGLTIIFFANTHTQDSWVVRLEKLTQVWRYISKVIASSDRESRVAEIIKDYLPKA